MNARHGSIWPQVSHNGKDVYYRLAPGVRGGESGHFVLHVDTGEVKKVAAIGDFQLGSDWTADGKRILGECPAPSFGICDLDPADGTVRKLFVHPRDQLLYPSQSWDGKRIVFGRRKPGGIAGIWIARLGPDGLEDERRWTEICHPTLTTAVSVSAPMAAPSITCSARAARASSLSRKSIRAPTRPAALS
jgi:hypothetical protein